MAISSALKGILKGSQKALSSGKNIVKGKIAPYMDKLFDGTLKEKLSPIIKKKFDDGVSGINSGINKGQDGFKNNMTNSFGSNGGIFAGVINGGLNASGKAVGLLSKFFYKGGKKILQNTIKTPVKNPDKFLGYDLGMTTRSKVVIGGGMVGYGLYSGLESAYFRSKHGDIEADEMPLSVNASFTPQLQKELDYAQASMNGAENFKNKVLERNNLARLSNVDPDIVFALHELRNQQR